MSEERCKKCGDLLIAHDYGIPCPCDPGKEDCPLKTKLTEKIDTYYAKAPDGGAHPHMIVSKTGGGPWVRVQDYIDLQKQLDEWKIAAREEGHVADELRKELSEKVRQLGEKDTEIENYKICVDRRDKRLAKIAHYIDEAFKRNGPVPWSIIKSIAEGRE